MRPETSSVEPADVKAGKAENTKDDYLTLKEQSGRNRKGLEVFYIMDWRWFNQCGTDPVSNRRETRLDSPECLGK